VFAQAGMARRTPPPLPDCQGGGQLAGDPPKITSPLKGSTYQIRVSRLGNERIGFAATTDAGSRTLYWFVDDAYLGSVPSGQPLMWAPDRTGRFLIRVVDDHGRTDSRDLSIGAVE
jgi:penicillin-binding protein 1C